MFGDDYYMQDEDQIMIPTKDGYEVIPAPNIRNREEDENFNRVKKNSTQVSKHLINNIQSGFMLAGVVSILAFIVYSLAGPIGVLIIAAIGGLGFLFDRDFYIKLLSSRPQRSENSF